MVLSYFNKRKEVNIDMAKQFEDFFFCGKRLSEVLPNCISVDFDTNDEINLSLAREMTKGDTNRYKIEADYFYDEWSDTLSFELDIIKDTCKFDNQKEMEFAKEEIRKITRWLTSSHTPEWINFEYSAEYDNDGRNYCGWFNNIETFVVGGIVYGLKLSFKCTTPFAYTDTIEKTITVTKNYVVDMISNESDDLEDYVYPILKIHPNSDGEIFIANTTDMEVMKQGTLTLGSSGSYIDVLLDIIEAYAKKEGCTVEYTGTGAYNIQPMCDDTVIQFYFIDIYGNRTKYTGYYKITTKEYQIVQGGFMTIKVYKGLDVTIDTKRLLIYDSLNRMVAYDKLGISDVDQMYWLRFINGNNTFLLYGDFNLNISYVEARKVGE